MPKSKAEILREKARSGDWDGAFRIAASFQDLGAERNAILDARTALTNPRWIKQFGRDPDAVVQAGKNAMIARYKI